MVDFFDEFISPDVIDISKLLKEVDLPVRIKNILINDKFYSEESFFKTIDKLVLEHTSHYLFPNSLISFYPQVREHSASRDLVCNLSGARIKKGSLYYIYHPFMEDLSTGKVYTIKKQIKAELGYIDYFPQDLATYEEWYYKVKNADYQSSDNIDFYGLSCECGDSCLEPYLLGFGKRRKK